MAFASGCDWSRVWATERPLTRVKSPSWLATICMPEQALMASSNPFLRSIAGEAPVVPSSSMIFALPPVALAIAQAARLPSWTKSDVMTETKSWPGLATLWSTSRSTRNTGIPAAPASLTTLPSCSVIGAMNRASGFCAMRPLMSWICLAWSLFASVTVSFQPRLAASSLKLAVSARRQGLLLAFWLKAMLYVLFFVSLGAPLALATPDGGAELPGSGAPTRAQLAFEALLPPPAAAEVADVPLLPVEHAASTLPASAAVPRTPSVLAFLRWIVTAVSSGIDTGRHSRPGRVRALLPIPGLRYQ